MARLTVRMTIPELQPQDVGCVVRVVIRDTSMADAEHPTVLEVTDVVGHDGVPDIVMDVPPGSLLSRHRYSLWVHVDHRGEGVMQRGDLIITQNVPVSEDHLASGAQPLDVVLTRI